MISLSDIDNAEWAIKNIRVALQAIGRDLYQMREGQALGSEYGFHGYSRENFCGTNYAGQDGPDWNVGTPIFSLTYYWPRAENYIHVTFPQGWLEQDWKARETERLDKEHATLEAQKAAELDRSARYREDMGRKAYARLKAKYEGSQP